MIYYVMYEEECILFVGAERMSLNKNNKYLSCFTDNQLNRIGRGIENIENNKYLNYSRNNITDRNRYDVNFFNDHSFYKSLFPERINLVGSVNNLNGFDTNVPLINKSPLNLGESRQDRVKMDLLGLKSYNNMDANLYESKNDVRNSIDANAEAEEITDKSPFYETNLYINSIKKPQNMIPIDCVKKSEEGYLANNAIDHSRFYRSKNVDNASGGETDSRRSDGTFNQGIMLTGAENSQQKFNNENNALNPLVQNNNSNIGLLENGLANLNPKILQNNSPFKSDDNNLAKETTNISKPFVNVKDTASPEMSSVFVKKNSDQKENYTDDFSVQNLKKIENLTGGNTLDLSNKNNYSSDDRRSLKESNNYHKINVQDVKYENNDNFFQQLQENLTKMNLLKPMRSFNTIAADFDGNRYHTGSMRPQLLLQDDRDVPANFNFRNLIGDNFTRHHDDTDLSEYFSGDNDLKRNKISKTRFIEGEVNVTNSSRNYGYPLLSVNGEKISSCDISKLTDANAAIAGGGGLRSDAKFSGFLSQPLPNTKVNIKDPKLIQNLRKIDISLLSFPPAFNYGLPIKQKKMSIVEKVLKRSIPTIRLLMANQPKRSSAYRPDSDAFPGNASGPDTMPGGSQQQDNDTYKPLNNYTAFKFLNPKRPPNVTNSFPKYFAINSTSSDNDPTYFKKDQSFRKDQGLNVQTDLLKNWNIIPETLIKLDKLPNLTQEIDNDARLVKIIGLEKSLKQLSNASSSDTNVDHPQQVMAWLLPKIGVHHQKKQVHTDKVKSKNLRTDQDDTDCNAEYYKNINSSVADFITEHSDNGQEPRQPVQFDNNNFDNVSSSNTSDDVPNKNQVAHIKLLGFVFEKTDPEKSNNYLINSKLFSTQQALS